MIDEKLQFAISQYVDGTLPPEEAAQVEARLAADAQARALWQEYRRLDVMVKTAMPVPEMDFDALTRRISAAVEAGADGAQRAPMALVAAARVNWNWRPLALAAGLLICATAAVITWRTGVPNQVIPGGGSLALQPSPQEGYASVDVFRTDGPVTIAEVQVQIGRAERNENPMLLAMAEAYPEAYPELTSRRQARVLISALPVTMADEDSMLLH